MSKPTDKSTNAPKSLTPEELTALERTNELIKERKKREEELRAQGMTDREILYETTEL